METPAVSWYIVKQSGGSCEIVSAEQLDDNSPGNISENHENPTRWGPFASRDEAIARRVGLIRAGKCHPI